MSAVHFLALSCLVLFCSCWAEKRCVDILCPEDQFLNELDCTCQPKPEGILACPLIRCPYAFIPCLEYAKDDRGCITCTCKCFEFAAICPVDCKYGSEYAIDDRGCKVCRCKDGPIQCPPVCKNYCPFGRILDAQGCPTCRCKEPKVTGPSYVCPDVQCGLSCDNGYVLNSRGCPVCQCKP